MATLPATQRGTAKVMPGRGVKINGVHYWAEAFRDPFGRESRCCNPVRALRYGHSLRVRESPLDGMSLRILCSTAWPFAERDHVRVEGSAAPKPVAFARPVYSDRAEAGGIPHIRGERGETPYTTVARQRKQRHPAERAFPCPRFSMQREPTRGPTNGDGNTDSERLSSSRPQLFTETSDGGGDASKPSRAGIATGPFSRLYRSASQALQAKESLMNAINGAEPNSLIFVFGPTGVGKTTLRLKAEQLITTELLNDSQRRSHESSSCQCRSGGSRVRKFQLARPLQTHPPPA